LQHNTTLYTSEREEVRITVIDNGLSDHHPVVARVNGGESAKHPPPTMQEVQDFNKIGEQELLRELQTHRDRWQILFDAENVDDMVKIFLDVVGDVVNSLAPKRTIMIRAKRKVKLTRQTRNLMRERDKARRSDAT
jgi:hypothetical protein